MELIITASVFLLGFIAFLAAFMPRNIWVKLPLKGIILGILVWGIAAGILFSGTSELLPSIFTMVVPSILISFFMSSLNLSDDFMEGYFRGLITPFILGSFVVLIIGIYTNPSRWFEFLLGCIGGALSCVLAIWFGFEWFKIAKNMSVNFSTSQASFTMLGVSFLGTSIGIFVIYAYQTIA